jgi:hypothetical protein
MIVSIGTVGKPLEGIIEQSIRGGLSVINVGGRDAHLLD